MGWFRRRKEEKGSLPDKVTSGEPTYRQRVDQFWKWWAENSGRILDSVDQDGGAAIQPEISQAVNGLGASFGWVFGSGRDGARHSFTLTPEGCPSCRYLARYWLARAPELPEWNLFSSRQASPDFGGTSIKLGDVELKADSLWVTPSVDEENSEIDITVWSPLFAEIPENQAMQVLFLYLDEALGEEGTSRCLGAIDLGDGKLDRSFPLTELPEFVDRTFAEKEWNRELLGSVYQIESPQGDFPRGDIFVGSTEHMRLIGDFANAGGPVENPIPDSGADFVFLQLPKAVVAEGSETDDRGRIEDGLEAVLVPDFGHVLGGATGVHAVYIDLLLYDGENSRERIEQALAAQGLADQYQLFSFVK